MNTHTQPRHDHRFAIGLLTGACVGVGLALWFAPRSASELRQRVTDAAKGLGRLASEQYQHASSRVGDVVDDLTRKGQSVRDDVADVVARSAHEVERVATAAKTDRTADIRKQVS